MINRTIVRKIYVDDYIWERDRTVNRLLECHSVLREMGVEVARDVLFVEIENEDGRNLGWADLPMLKSGAVEEIEFPAPERSG